MGTSLLEKRRKELLKQRWLPIWRKIVFFLVFFLLLFSNPQFINTEMMGSMETSVYMAETLHSAEENGENGDGCGVIEENCPEDEQELKIAYLTFDDGPTIYLTKILDILAEYEAQATFFMLEPQMKAHATVLCGLHEAGHGLGLHGVTHNYRLFYASRESVLGEMNTAQATLAEITGIKSVLIRTPYGSKPYLKPAYKEAIEEAGYQLWDWNVDSRDWFYRDERMVTDTIQQLAVLGKKEITPVILLHECRETVQFLPQILDYLQSEAYVLRAPSAETLPVQF